MSIIVREIWVYPIKSTRGFRLPQTDVLSEGLRFDRRWMLVDAEGHFLTARTYPKMLQIKATIEGSFLVVSAPCMELLSIPFDGEVGKEQDVEIWGNVCQAFRVSSKIDEWFSSYMGFSCCLVRTSHKSPRRMKPKHSLDGKGIVSFADAFPLLVISQASLDVLNQRLAVPVSMERFRPNLVVDGCSAFAEDRWSHFQVAGVSFRGGKLCDRCVLTTLDPRSGEQGKEPLTTLATFRKKGQKVFFGLNVVPLSVGLVREGDELFVLEEKAPADVFF